MESCARTQDRKWNVQRTPSRAQGAELPFKRLLEKEVGNFVSFMSLIILFIHATENTVTYGTTIQALLIFFACLMSNTLLILQVKNNADGLWEWLMGPPFKHCSFSSLALSLTLYLFYRWRTMQMALLKWKLKYQEMEQGFPIAAICSFAHLPLWKMAKDVCLVQVHFLPFFCCRSTK